MVRVRVKVSWGVSPGVSKGDVVSDSRFTRMTKHGHSGDFHKSYQQQSGEAATHIQLDMAVFVLYEKRIVYRL